MQILNKLGDETIQKYYWAGLIIFSLALEASALFYQYVLDYLPCVLCIHVRVYLLGLILVSILGFLTTKNRFAKLLAHSLSLAIFIGLAERSYQLLGTERGFVFGECNMELGLPAWLALDQWLPSVFQVHTSCGYTPELLFGITMAEALMLISSVLVIVGFTILVRLFYEIFLEPRSTHV